ncbi:MAG: proline dehydrogenase family protein, partial [Chloroflexi bacterium]|nr:proline dehydrogenase family protein [Chloroflexota bacterium]
LSQSARVRALVMGFPLSRRFARRFVAGETLDEGIAAVKRLNGRGLLATFDHLGENVHSADEAQTAAEDYIQILDAIEKNRLRANVSLKLTQMGLDVDPQLCLDNVARIVAHARECRNFVRIDMEGSAYTQRTLDVYYHLRDEGFDNVGVVIQSYLYRSTDDVRALASLGARIRICKGAYGEPPTIAFAKKSDVDATYRKLVELMWTPDAIAKGAIAALATHDESIIQWAKAEAMKRGVTKDQFEFQMLYGIRRERQVRLVKEGYRFRVYVPYGTQWYPYFMRRLAERPANLFFLLRNLFQA